MANSFRGTMPPYLDRVTKFFWHVDIQDVDFHLEYKENHQAFKQAHWCWRGGLHKGITPWMKDKPNERYVSTRQWILKQLRPDGNRRSYMQECNPDLICVNPFHMTLRNRSPRGRPRKIPIDIEFPEVMDRERLLHYAWTNLMRTEEETHKQRSLPQYFS